MNGNLVYDSILTLGISTLWIYSAYSVTKRMILNNYDPIFLKNKKSKRIKDYLWSLILAPISPIFYCFILYNKKGNDSLSEELRLAFCLLVSIASLIGVLSAHLEIDKQNKKGK